MRLVLRSPCPLWRNLGITALEKAVSSPKWCQGNPDPRAGWEHQARVQLGSLVLSPRCGVSVGFSVSWDSP